jgi:hypothetical protein
VESEESELPLFAQGSFKGFFTGHLKRGLINLK